MNDSKVTQQIVDKIKSSTNILVTVSTNPSVDALSAALGLTVLLNKLNKHATAVFSGAIPPAITFLDPDNTFEDTVDSLRDFIIALDKEKADHLRYKVEGDVVKIFITPYKTTINSDDLEFSQGDYNVELVMALGVDDQAHLDSALEAHGRILHDATVVTFTAGEQTSDLGSLDWHDAQASSLSEMLVGLSDKLKEDAPLLDAEIATAFLTGIVAATDRFSNTHTSSNVMSVAAQLMAAGADQQLIASKLQESHTIDTTPASSQESSDEPAQPVGVYAGDGGLSIDHLKGETLEQIADEVAAHNQQQAANEADRVLTKQTNSDASLLATSPPVTEPSQPATGGALASAYAPEPPSEPSLGGTLNATTEAAAEDTQRELEGDQNKTLLSHSYLSGAPDAVPPINGATESTEGSHDVDIFADKQAPSATPATPSPDAAIDAIVASSAPAATSATLADLNDQTLSRDHDEARAAVQDALGTQPAPLSPLDLPPPPPLPDFANLPPAPLASAYAFDPATDTNAPAERLGDILAPEPTPPVTPPVPPVSSPTTPVAPDDPGQFKIPGQ